MKRLTMSELNPVRSVVHILFGNICQTEKNTSSAQMQTVRVNQ